MGVGTGESLKKGEASVSVEGVTKEYGEQTAVRDLSFEVVEGEIFCLLGPSGCGKTTTLRCIAGLDEPDNGKVRIGEKNVTENPAHSRDTSVVFQEWALFPRKTVLENVAFSSKMDGDPREERKKTAEQVLESVGLSEEHDSYPRELSGGQKQRVALARSLAADPSVLLLDEPFSNLDKGLRHEMRLELLELHEEFGKTVVHVTHDQEEAFTLADRLGVMRDGSLVQVGEPSEVYSEPKTRFVESFLGENSFVQGTLRDGTVETDLGKFELENGTEAGKRSGTSAEVSVRPESVSLSGTRSARERDGAEGNTGEIVSRINQGSTVKYVVEIVENRVAAEYSSRNDPQLHDGEVVEVSVTGDPPVFDADGERIG